ncbi:MAG: regulatory protein RecX [Acetatifactor sp.]|nr:regulatory protein RecX [Acetatifactor sp.]
MKVTQIEALSKTRSKIYIEGEFAFVLYRGELRLYHVREGEEISEQDYRAILDEVLPKRAKLRAMNLLQKREYTVEELRRKLRQGCYPPEVIEEALSYVASYRYTDDMRYAEDYITVHAEDRSRRRIEQDLMAKGISKDTIEKAWQVWQDKGGVWDEQEQIWNLLRKRNYDPAGADQKERQKTYAFLMRKGFSTETIHRVLRAEEYFD